MNLVEKKIYLGLLVCLLVSIIGVSFAYFAGGVNVGGTGSATNATITDLLEVTYDAGSKAISLPADAIPGAKDSKTFSVTVKPNEKQKSATYAINLKINSNSFVKCTSSNKTDANNCTLNATELYYALKDSSGSVIKSGDLAGQSGTIELEKVTRTVTSTTAYNYTLDVEFKNTGADQNHNANKSFSGTVEVVFAE